MTGVSASREILILQHQEDVPPALVGDFLGDIGRAARLHRLWADGDPPDPGRFSAVIALGGDMNVGEEGQYPFLAAERRLIAAALEREQPFLGICLGAQLLAAAAGGGVRRRDEMQFGWHSLRILQPDPLVDGFDPLWHVFQWRDYACELPPEAALIADDGVEPQIFRIGPRAWGVQFHPEIDKPVLNGWVESAPATVEHGWPGGVKKFRKVTNRELYRTALLCGRLLTNFLTESRLG